MITQEFQWSRSLVALLLTYTPRYLGRLPWRLRFQFVFCQALYPMMALTAYLGRRLGGLRVRREQRLHHRHRCTVLSSAVEGRVPDLYVAHTASRGTTEQ